ncbi:MAG: hypothetical protein JXA09_02355 [Anaerolineae bacterium]|nr:hypothetical protein [Anaerolineae bacterium]
MSADVPFPEEQGGAHPADYAARPAGVRWSAAQWTLLIAMAGMLLALGGALWMVLRAGLLGASVDVVATVAVETQAPLEAPALVGDAVLPQGDLYWPPDPQPLATPNAPSDLLWWDARYGYRRVLQFDAISAELPKGTWASVVFDGEGAQQAGKMRADGVDLRILVWDGNQWRQLPRRALPMREQGGWMVTFALQDPALTRTGRYYLYYGNPTAVEPPLAGDTPEAPRLLLSLGVEEGVEWGPEIAWTANSTTTQRLVSSDGRLVIECPPGGPRRDVRVRLRTVPGLERSPATPLPDFEFHVDASPGPPSRNNIVYWDPPLLVTINWAGLPVDPADLAAWTYFVYDETVDAWRSLPVEYDRGRGLLLLVTDQL